MGQIQLYLYKIAIIQLVDNLKRFIELLKKTYDEFDDIQCDFMTSTTAGKQYLEVLMEKGTKGGEFVLSRESSKSFFIFVFLLYIM